MSYRKPEYHKIEGGKDEVYCTPNVAFIAGAIAAYFEMISFISISTI